MTTSVLRSWVVAAACARPATRDLPWTTEYPLATQRREMAKICASCPVRSQCRAVTLQARLTAGFWAGRDFTVREGEERYEQHVEAIAHGA